MRLEEILNEEGGGAGGGAGGGDGGGGGDAGYGAVGANAFAGFRSSLFKQNKYLRRNKSKIGKVHVIRYARENNWNRK